MTQEATSLNPDASSQRRAGPHWHSRLAARVRAYPYRKAVRGGGVLVNRAAGDLVSVAIAVGIGVLFFAASLVSRQSADLGALRPNFQNWFSQGFQGANADFGDVQLRWNPSDDTVSFIATDVTVFDTDGAVVQTLPFFRATAARADVLARRPALKRVDVVGGAVTWRQSADGRVVAGLGTPETVGRFGPVYRGGGSDSESRQAGWLSDFEAVTLSGTQLFLIQEAEALSLRLDVGNLAARADGRNVEIELDGAVRRFGEEGSQREGGDISLSYRTADGFDTSSLNLDARGLNLSALAPSEGRLAALAAIDIPVDFSLSAERARPGTVRSAALTLTSGNGIVTIAGIEHDVEALSFDGSLEPGSEVMTINEVAILSDRLRLAGSGNLREIGRLYDGDVGTSPKFDLELEETWLDARPVFEGPIELTTTQLVGEVDLDTRSVTLDRLSARVRGVGLELSGQLVAGSGGGSGSVSRLVLQGGTRSPMEAPDLLSLWPVKAADGARRWIERSVQGGTVEDVSVSVDLDEAFFETGRPTADNVDVTFTARDGIVRFISTMNPLTEAMGTGRLSGNRFGFVLESGQLDGVEIVGGDVDIPRLVPKGGDILISVEGHGEADDVFAVVNQPPFQYFDKYGVDPADFGGQAEITLNIRRPLLEFFDQDRIEYSVEGSFMNASAPFGFGGFSLSDANVSLRGGKEGLFVEGPAKLGPWMAQLSWAERYGQNGEPTRYRMSGFMDRKTLDGFGLGFRQQFGGRIEVDVEATGQGMAIEDALVDVDLSEAELAFGSIWRKAPGNPATLRAALAREGARFNIPRLSVTAPGLELQGSIELRDGLALERAQFDTARIDGLIDGRVALSRDDVAARLVLDANGRRLNISEFVQQALDSTEGATDGLFALSLDAAFNDVVLADGYALTDASLVYRHDGEAVERLTLRGERPAGVLSASLRTDTSGVRTAKMDVPDISLALEHIAGLDATRGGSLSLEGELPPTGQDGAVIGSAILMDFDVRNAPFLAQILSLASLTGILDTLSGEGLHFDRLGFDFALEEGLFSIRNAKLRGPAIGMTGDGDIDLGERRVDISGALVPAYTANSFLGNIPVLGDLLVGREGEGVFAVNYAVEGPFSAALVTINPLSALTPGFIRGIFREDRASLPEATVEDIQSVRPAEPDGSDG